MSNSRNLISTLSFIAVFTIIGQLLMFYKETVFAKYFGISIEADIYFIAIQIPVILYAIMNVAISSAILPIYTKIKDKSQKDANEYFRNIITIFTSLSILISFLGFIFANEVVGLFAPSYSGEILEQTVYFTKITFFSTIFINLINIYKTIHNSNKSFYYPVISGYFNGILVVLSLLIFGTKYGIASPIFALIISYIIQFLILKFTALDFFKYKWKLSFKDKDIKDTLIHMIPIMIGVGVAEINRIIDRILATGLQSGAVSALNYSSKITTIIALILVSGISIVGFHDLTNTYISGNINEYKGKVLSFFTIAILLSLPASIGLVIFGEDIIYLIFESGSFNSQATKYTATILTFYAIGLMFITLREVFSRVFYSVGDTKTPMINATIGVVINIVLNIVLVKYFGASGLALATSISAFVITVLLFNSYLRRFGDSFKPYALVLLKATIASLIMLFIIMLLPEISTVLISLIVNVFIGIVVYFLSLILLREEFIIHYIREIRIK